MKKRLRKRFIITTISAFSLGIMLFIGGQLGGADHSIQTISKAASKKGSGKYAAENSEKAKFFSSKQRKAF